MSRLVKMPVDSITTSTPRSPQGKIGGVALAEHLEHVATDGDAALDCLDLFGEDAEHRVVLEQVCHGLERTEVVDGNEIDVGSRELGGSEEVPSDSAEAVDPDANGHVVVSLL